MANFDALCDMLSEISSWQFVVATNDYAALIHPDVDRETEEIIADTLKVKNISNQYQLTNQSFFKDNKRIKQDLFC